MVGGFRSCEGPGVEETPAWHCKMPGPCKISDHQCNAQERERESPCVVEGFCKDPGVD